MFSIGFHLWQVTPLLLSVANSGVDERTGSDVSTGGFQLWQVTPWILSAAALGLSAYNFYYTRKLQKSSIRRDEFNNRIGRPIESALADFDGGTYKLKPLLQSSSALSAQKSELDDMAAELTDRYDRLSDGLERAERNTLISGRDWQSEPGQHWNAFLECVAEAQDCTSVEAFHTQVLRARTIARLVVVTVENRIDQEAKQYS